MTFEEAQAGVKIGHFTRQGLKITGVIHVGANDGYEIKFYLALGARRVVAIEPGEDAYRKLEATWSEEPLVETIHCALGEHEGKQILNITQGDGQGSSFLREFNGPYTIVRNEEVQVLRGDTLALGLEGCNTLVVDTQGMELPVLRGFGNQLGFFDFLNIECSRVPLYEGGHSAQEVIDHLDSMGFQQDSPICDHDDIMFIRKGLK
jgi:FkbM family methyltransferase